MSGGYCYGANASSRGYDAEAGPVPDLSRFARGANGSLIDVHEIDPKERYAKGPFECLACRHVMVPALGRQRRHHFKHKAGRPADCQTETYLHQLAKMVLYRALTEAIEASTPFWLTRYVDGRCSSLLEHYGLVCTRQPVQIRVDLASTYDSVAMEAGADGFVADILLASSVSGERMLLEIAVTHACEEAKIASGLPILEIQVQDEGDAVHLGEGIDEMANNVRLHAIPDPDEVSFRCQKPCSISGLALLHYRSGKIWYAEVGLGPGQTDPVLSDPHLLDYEVVDVSFSGYRRSWAVVKEHLIDFMKRQYRAGHAVRSCILCQNNGGPVNNHDIHCLARSRNVWMSSGAVSCEDYHQDTWLIRY